MPRRRIMVGVGERYGQLTVTGTGIYDGDAVRYPCHCDCGNTTAARSHELRSGGKQSCGCLISIRSREVNLQHGRTKSREHPILVGMRKRCTYPKDAAFRYYGARGIKVCERWQSFAAFYADMGDCPPGHSIDRIDNDRGYSPENCRWANSLTQNHNRRIPHAPINVGSANGMAKINEDIARSIYRSRGSHKHIATQFDVSAAIVGAIKNRKSWTRATEEVAYG